MHNDVVIKSVPRITSTITPINVFDSQSVEIKFTFGDSMELESSYI